MSPLELMIRHRAWAYVQNELDRDLFMDCFAPVLMSPELVRDFAARDLAGDIAQFDAEFTSGAGSEEQLRELIRRRLHVYRSFTPLVEPDAPMVASGSGNVKLMKLHLAELEGA